MKILKSNNYLDIILLYKKIHKISKIGKYKYDNVFKYSIFYIFLEMMQKCSSENDKNIKYKFTNIINALIYFEYN